MNTSATLAAAAIVAAGGLAAAQTLSRPQATFRAEVNYVEVDLVVTDADGHFVPGLTAADFEVRDEGRPQTIEVFQEVNVPILTPAAMPPSGAPGVRAASDVVSNIETAEGRVYLLLLDDLHTQPAHTNDVRRRAREFIEGYVGENDLAAVVYASGRGAGTQDFTSNRALLLAAVDKFAGRGLKSAVENRIDEALEGRAARDRVARERLMAARGTFRAVRDVAAALTSMSGRRKALLLFSEGIDLESDAAGSADASPLSPRFSDAREARTAMLETIAVATRANVHVYAIDASRLSGGGIGADRPAVAGSGRDSFETAEAEGLTSQAMAEERRRAIGTLRTIAEQTGGIAIVDTLGFAGGYARIQQENSTYYVLGFYPTTDRDGKFHQLDVRVRRPGLQVKSRPGFHAAKPADSDAAAAGSGAGAARDPLAALLTATLPSPGLPMRLSLPVFRKSRSESTVLMAVDVPPGVLRFEDAGTSLAEDFRLVYQVIDPPSTIVASAAQDLEMRLRPDTRALVDARGFRAVFPVALKPGRYQVRVAASAKNGARAGSVFADLEVPDFSRARLSWSGVAITSAAAAGVPTRPAGEGTSTMIPVMPAAVRRFEPDDTLAVYAEIYDNGARGGDAIDLTAEVRHASGAVVFTMTEQRASAAARNDRGGHGFRVDIPLGGLAPGSYVLTLTARSRADGSATAARDIPFAISLEP